MVLPDDEDNSEGRKSRDVTDAHDFYAVLRRIVDQAGKDPAQIRNLVYSLARQHLWSETSLLRPPLGLQPQSTIMSALHQALELEEAIKRLETEAAEAAQQEQSSLGVSPTPQHDLAHLLGEWNHNEKHPQQFDEPTASADCAQTHSDRQLPENAVALVPERHVSPEHLAESNFALQAPLWFESRAARNAPDTIDYVPVNALRDRRGLLKSNGQLLGHLLGAAALGIVLVMAAFGWVYLRRPSQVKPDAPVAVITHIPGTTTSSNALASDGMPASSTQTQFPFPLPKSYGVFAVNDGHLVELEPLPIRVPDPRILVSAPINSPSRVKVATGKLAFVLFRRDLATSAPPTASVRVVARVARAMRFVEGKAVIGPVEGGWRLRANSYRLKVSPVDGNREMIVMQPDPDFAFPAGRYALVANGVGYDFTVDGPITSLDQCLEQVEAVNGTMLSECPKS